MDQETDKSTPRIAVQASNKNKTQTPRVDKQRAIGAAFMILLSVSSGFIGGWLGAESQGGTRTTTSETRQVVLNESQLINEIAKSAGPSVVSVNVVSETAGADFFGFGRNYQQQSAGTGFIISKDGIVVTNRHVIPRATKEVTLTLSDGTELDKVDVIGRTSESDPLDIAFLRIKDTKGKELKPLPLADSAKVEVGDQVVAIGNALGQFQNTVTSGIISGYGRNIVAGSQSGAETETLQNLFQTDAAINQGNSGGPLVNVNGEVIGINTAVAGSGENIGFAIPINDVKGLIRSVQEKGQLLRPYLGVRYVSLTDDLAYQYNLDVSRGAYIVPSNNRRASILEGSPADDAGLQERDVITKINDIAIDEDNSLASVLGRFSVDEEVTLTIVRDGEEQTKRVRLEAAPTE